MFALGSYLNREQYGKTPLLYGPTYASPVERDDTGAAVMTKASKYVKEVKASPDEPDRYKEIDDNYNTEYSYPSSTKMLFPRLYDSSAKDKYLRCMGTIDTHPVETGSSVVDVPTFSENIRYFFQYQLNYMYWRYFLWNLPAVRTTCRVKAKSTTATGSAAFRLSTTPASATRICSPTT